MKKKSLFAAIAAAAGILLIGADADAQRPFVERPGASVGVRFAGDWRASNSLHHLNRELRDVELIASRRAGLRARGRLTRIARATDRLNYEYRRRLTRSWLIHRRAEALRAELRAIRNGLRGRGWRWP